MLPTASVRRRAQCLAELIDRTSTGDGPIHILGHSTGGLDARLVASPGATLSMSVDVGFKLSQQSAAAWIASGYAEP